MINGSVLPDCLPVWHLPPLVCRGRGCLPRSPEYTDDVHPAEPASARAPPSAFAVTHKKGTNEFYVEWGHIH